METSFYVYAYLDPTKFGKFDLENFVSLFSPLYVGKGKENRLNHGLGAVDAAKPQLTNRRLYCKLVSLKKKGFDPVVVKIKSDMTSAKALELEAMLIKRFGRKVFDHRGILLNIALGGEIPDTTGVPPSNKGKSISQLYSEEKVKQIRSILSLPKSQKTKDKMVNTRMSKGTYYTKDLHPRAKHFTAINPEGVAFELHGNLKDFCKEMNLSWQTFYGNLNSGIIILDRSRYKNLSRLTNRFFNTLGWQIYSQ